MTYTIWNPEMTEKLTQLWREGKSFSQIGEIMGFTRSAIAGRIRRLGLLGDRQKKSTLPPPKPPKLAKPKKPKPLPIIAPEADMEEVVEETPAPQGLQLIDLDPKSCRWPFGDPRDADFYFCGKTRKNEFTPYCREHHALAYTPARRGGSYAQAEGKQGLKTTQPSWLKRIPGTGL